MIMKFMIIVREKNYIYFSSLLFIPKIGSFTDAHHCIQFGIPIWFDDFSLGEMPFP